MYRGYIKLYRCILDNPVVMKDPECLAVRIYLLLKACYGGHDVRFDGKRLALMDGQLVIGRKKISETLRINESKVQRVLKLFEKNRQIEQQTTNNGRLITIVNWAKYQNGESVTGRDSHNN